MQAATSADCLIVGGGIIGCALARELARRGARVRLLEAGAQVAAEASGAAVGTLSYSPSAEMPDAWHALAARSLEAHRLLAAALAEEVADPPVWHWPGRLNIVTTNAAEKYARARLKEDQQRGAEGRWLDKRAIHELEPALAGRVQGGSFNPGIGWVDGAHLARSLARSARERGADVVLQAPVERLLWEGERGVGAVAGGTSYRAEALFIAAGAWSGRLDARLAVPVEPVRGQALHVSLEGTEAPQPLLRHLVSGEGIYMIPEGAGITVGATHERVGFARGATVGGVAKLLGRATSLLPPLDRADWQNVRIWSGFRPATPDRLPIMGPDPRYPGLWWATGHFRSGVLLAPLTARLLADAFLEGREIDERLSVARWEGQGGTSPPGC